MEKNKKLGILLIFFLLIIPAFFIQFNIYITLTIAGFAMGMLIFLIASGLSIIFGLMDVLNFAHGALFAWGAYIGFTILKKCSVLAEANSIISNISVLTLSIAGAVFFVAIIGIIMEKVLIRKVYGSHLFQILITFGATIVLVELIRVFWGPNDEVVIRPFIFKGNWNFMGIIVEKYRIICIAIGLTVYGCIQAILKKTKIGIIVRAGVENREMVQAMGHNIHMLFTGVFAMGAGLAALGGVAVSIFERQIYPDMGNSYLIFAFIVVIIGGLGSITGSLVGALIVGFAYNYVAYLIPWAASAANVLIMIIILMICPKGLFPVGK
jgi:branched-chain amino acid transport system permease protein